MSRMDQREARFPQIEREAKAKIEADRKAREENTARLRAERKARDAGTAPENATKKRSH